MRPSSIARRRSGQRVIHRGDGEPDSAREYRRDRQHLYPLEEYEAALAVGGVVTSYCGLDENVERGDRADVEEVAGPDADDCVTCVDVWSGCARVRL